MNFQIYMINITREKGLVNETISKWEENILNLNRYDKLGSSNIYIDEINNNSLISYPSYVKEIFSRENDINSINLLIDRVKASNNNIEKIVIDLPNELYTLEELENIKDKEMVVFGSEKDITRITVDEMINTEKTLDLFVRDIKTSDLSPYERYIAVYNIVKSFKKYQFYKNNKDIDSDYLDQSRNIYLIMQNDYIVCVGYARLLETLLRRVGVNSVTWDVQTNNSRDGHERNYVYIEDPKYGIDGYYMCDATWDKTQYEIMSNGYDYLHNTTKESRKEKEFDKSVDSKASLCDELFNDYTDEEMLNYLKNGIDIHNNFYKAKEVMKKLDPNFYNKIKDKELNFELASEINSYLKTKLNKEISNEKDIYAIFKINVFVEGKKYTKEEYVEKWNDYIIKYGHSYDFLKSDYNEDINNYFEQFKNIKLSEYYNLINNNKLGEYKKMCMYQAFNNLSSQFLAQENETFFGITYDNNTNKLLMNIYISNELFQSGKIDEIKEKLEEMGYEINLVPGTSYNIILDVIYMDKTFVETFTDLENIKNDYLTIYNDVLGTKIK